MKADLQRWQLQAFVLRNVYEIGLDRVLLDAILSNGIDKFQNYILQTIKPNW